MRDKSPGEWRIPIGLLQDTRLQAIVDKVHGSDPLLARRAVFYPRSDGKSGAQINRGLPLRDGYAGGYPL